ncbi:hypothetical protein MMC28_005374 [Mycoblastus sanguinarius]|nr:hypothetical protein [Mycoblastus sanguinarius]
MAHQAQGDFEEPQPQFDFADMDQSNPVRIRMHSLPSAGTAVAMRANVMWALKMLPITLFRSPSIWGMKFCEQYHGRNIYSGILDNRNAPLITLEASNQTSTVNFSQLAAESKRALDYQMLNVTTEGPIATTSNTTTTFLAIPGSSDKEYQVMFHFIGSQLPKIDIFSILLEFLLILGARDSVEQVASINLSGAEYPVWIYIFRNEIVQIIQIFQIFQVIAIADAIARHYVQQRNYQEMIFNFYVDGQVIASGCVTKADRSREWCAGMRRDFRRVKSV